MCTKILKSTLKMQLAIVETALHDGENVIIAGNCAVGKTVLLKALEKSLKDKDRNAAYFTMNTIESEVEKIKEEIYIQCTDKILIIDEFRTLVAHGLHLKMIDSELPLVVSFQTISTSDLNASVSELNLDNYFNKLIWLKNSEGDLEVINIEKIS